MSKMPDLIFWTTVVEALDFRKRELSAYLDSHKSVNDVTFYERIDYECTLEALKRARVTLRQVRYAEHVY